MQQFIRGTKKTQNQKPVLQSMVPNRNKGNLHVLEKQDNDISVHKKTVD